MDGTLYAGMAAIDTSAVIALRDPEDAFHAIALDTLEGNASLAWAVLNITSHEAYTRWRYDRDFPGAVGCFDFLRREGGFRQLTFLPQDEAQARSILIQYSDQTLSFHDALCAAVMLRNGIGKIFTFDRHFWILGFEVIPGFTR